MPDQVTVGTNVELAVRDRFIGHLWMTRTKAQAIAAEDQVWLSHLARTAFLVSRPVAHFVHWTVPALLRKLSCQTEPRPVESRGEVRGRIDWQTTWKARYLKEVQPVTFVCRQVNRQYAIPENELLKYVLEQLRRLAEEVPAVLRWGAYWSPDQPYHSLPVQRALADLYEQSRRHLKHVYLREIKTPGTISSQHLLRARSTKTEEYSEVADIYQSYRGVATEVHIQEAIRTLHHCVVLPASLSGPGEHLVRLVAQTLLTTPAESALELQS